MEKAYNLLANNPRVVVLDARNLKSYNAGHIRGSFCVRLSSDGKGLEKIAGPGWSSRCWWDRHVLLITSSSPTPPASKKRKLEQSDPVLQFLSQEGLVKSLLVLYNDPTVGNDKANTFSSFTRQYPFLVTKSHKATLISRYPSEVLPQLLYLGDMENAKSKSQLEELKITHVVTIHSDSIQFDKSLIHMFLELADEPTANIAQYFEPVFKFIQDVEKTGGRVLVHCGAGASRSATLCAAYLMRTKLWGVDDALKYLKESRSQVCPNHGFISALYAYQKSLLCMSKRTTTLDSTIPVQVCCAQKEKNTDGVGSAPELQLEIQKEGRHLGFIALAVRQAIIFGRASSCDVVLDHASISRQHAKMVNTGNTLVLTDLRSAHGTFLNGKLLKSGQEIVVNVLDNVRFGASTRNYILHSTSF